VEDFGKAERAREGQDFATSTYIHHPPPRPAPVIRLGSPPMEERPPPRPTSSSGPRPLQIGVESTFHRLGRPRHPRTLRSREGGVSMYVGATALTRTPRSAHSAARDRVRCVQLPAFEALYWLLLRPITMSRGHRSHVHDRACLRSSIPPPNAPTAIEDTVEGSRP